LSGACPQSRTDATEVATDRHNLPGHNPHFAMDPEKSPQYQSTHFANHLHNSHSSNNNNIISQFIMLTTST